MKLAYYFFVFLLSFNYSLEAQAATTNKYEYDIPTLNGVYSEPYRTKIFLDINTKFSQITNAELYLEGTAEPGSAYCLKDGIQLPIMPEVKIIIELDDRIRHLTLTRTPFATFGPLNGSYKDKKPFTSMPTNVPIAWPFIKNGKDVLILAWGRAYPDPCSSIKYSKLTITKAKLFIEGIKQSDSVNKSKTETRYASQIPPIVESFACSDYCPGPKELYMERVYEGITSEEECYKLGGRFATFVGWGTFHICVAE